MSSNLHHTRRLAAIVIAITAAACSKAEPGAGASAPAAETAARSPAAAAPGDASAAAPHAGAPASTQAAAPARAALATSAEGLPTVELEKDLLVRELGPGVHVITHSHPWPANALLVEMASGELVLCDPTYTPAAMRRVLEWAKGRFGERRITAINTHFHVDRIGGNAALVERGIPVHGSDLTAKTLAERGAAHRAWVRANVEDKAIAAELNAQKDVPPDHLFSAAEGLTLRFGGEEVLVRYPGPGHAPDNVVVFFPSRGLLFGGCLVGAGERIGNTADADLGRWGDAIREVQRLQPKVVIPGHGDRYDAGLLEHTLKLLAEAKR